MDIALRRKLFVILLIAAVVGATVYGFFPKAVDVDLASVTRGPLQVTIEEEGRTRLKERFVITAPIAGYMERLRAKVGDPVEKGQRVVVLEPLRSPALDPRSRAEAEAVLTAAEAALSAAVEKESAAAADADYAGKRLERLKNLYAKGSIAKDQYDQIEAEAKKARAIAQAAKAGVDVARSDRERAKTLLRNYSAPGKTASSNKVYVATPTGGSIFRIYRESEGPVNVGEPLLDIGNIKNLEVRVEVLSSDAVKIKPGTAVFFKRWGGQGTLEGTVRIVEPAGFTKISSLGVEEQRVLVIADITSPVQMWRELGDGYRLEAHFVVWEGKNVLQIPTSALFRSGKDWAVFVAAKGNAVKRLIEAGQRNSSMTEIISGLQENEKIIVHPADEIKDGTWISPRK
ncbi:MAG: efflux transporter periplasmic adaptor subunit [Deltaproteobacteria bacterium HGW-Deltaproteobacteria-12]|jgi:HlyD family secretion protein|nr:MAG: efflux transporter periplasmic adaptor subunit [Deltaproteobacteria bacterium HGW-Deltaproteobacteria-12]